MKVIMAASGLQHMLMWRRDGGTKRKTFQNQSDLSIASIAQREEGKEIEISRRGGFRNKKEKQGLEKFAE